MVINFTSLSKNLLNNCIKKNIQLLTAESCTGGLLSANITSVAGSSDAFLHGFICYSNESKQKFLNVSNKTISNYGAVSSETVKEMLMGLCSQAKSRVLTIAISGVAGPRSSEAKPIGLVFIGIKLSNSNYEVIDKINFGNIGRNHIQQKSVEEALKRSLKLLNSIRNF